MSDTTDELIEQALDLVSKPQSVAKGDASLARQNLRGLSDLIKTVADIEAADVASSQPDRPGFGLRFQKITPYYR
jgi:hypothetical protein